MTVEAVFTERFIALLGRKTNPCNKKSFNQISQNLNKKVTKEYKVKVKLKLKKIKVMLNIWSGIKEI